MPESVDRNCADAIEHDVKGVDLHVSSIVVLRRLRESHFAMLKHEKNLDFAICQTLFSNAQREQGTCVCVLTIVPTSRGLFGIG